jgi:hypothetical protein
VGVEPAISAENTQLTDSENATISKSAVKPLYKHCLKFPELQPSDFPAWCKSTLKRFCSISNVGLCKPEGNGDAANQPTQDLQSVSGEFDKIESELLEDAEERAVARAREAVWRREEDRELVARMAKQIGVLFPDCPASELAALAQHTAARGSGRVGRAEAGRNLEDQALTAAIIAAVRHHRTWHVAMLARGIDRMIGRQRVAGKIEDILAAWRT